MNHKLLPEWVKQEAIILAWPDKQTDWAPMLAEVQTTYSHLMTAINQADCAVLLLIREAEIVHAKSLLADASSVVLLKADYNDTWVRDYGFLTLGDGVNLYPVEFSFNGWGNKFDATKDNRINQMVLAPLMNQPIEPLDLVCEGGAFEIDAEGHLLSTELCLSNPERNGDKAMSSYQASFEAMLGASRVTIYQNGHLQGDDTDGHIDTLVRYTLNKGLVVQGCYNRPEDIHFEGLKALIAEVKLSHPDHEIFELPLPEVISEEGDRLPASYANFLICNDAVLCPIYRQAEDEEALAIIGQAYPNHQIVGIDCLSLVQQYGGLHCITMHVPEGIFKSDVTDQFGQGVVEL